MERKFTEGLCVEIYKRSPRPLGLPVKNLAAESQLYFIGPLALGLIFLILFALYGNFKFPATIAIGVVITEPVGALIALKLTHYAIQCVFGAGLARAAEGFGRDRSDPGLLHQ